MLIFMVDSGRIYLAQEWEGNKDKAMGESQSVQAAHCIGHFERQKFCYKDMLNYVWNYI